MLAAMAAFVGGTGTVGAVATFGAPPPGFTSANAAGVHYVRGGRGPAIILLHGFPQDWAEFHAIMPRLARRFTVVAIDLPGIGRSAPAAGGYEAANLAARIHAMAEALRLERPYLVGHDLGGIVTYAYVRRFPAALRGAMILDVPMPGIDGWDEAGHGAWHVGLFQAPGRLAEQLTEGRGAAPLLGWFLDLGRFSPAERAYFIRSYRAPQLHAAFETYRAFPRDVEYLSAQTDPNPVPLTVALADHSPFANLQPRFLASYRAHGMSRVEGARIANASHYVLADNPGGVAEMIERFGGAAQ